MYFVARTDRVGERESPQESFVDHWEVVETKAEAVALWTTYLNDAHLYCAIWGPIHGSTDDHLYGAGAPWWHRFRDRFLRPRA